MVSAADIQSLLENAFAGDAVTVTDDSAKHSGHASAPAAGGSHFTVRVVSVKFSGQSRIGRHRSVYAVLQPLFDQGLHALAIETFAPDEVKRRAP